MHQPSGGIGGTASTSRSRPSRCCTSKKQHGRADRPAHRPAVEQIERDADRDRWFTAEEALEYGFIDQVVAQRRRRSPAAAAPAPEPPVPSSLDRSTPRGATPMNTSLPQRPRHPRRYGQPLHPAAVRGAHLLRASRESTPTPSCSRSAIIFLGVQIDDASANDVMAQLLCLESMDPDRDINIYINRPGGSFTALTAIYDTMQFIKPDIQTVCLGQAASAAAVLLAAGTPGQAAGAAEHPDPDPPAVHRGRATARPPTSRSRPTRSCGCASCSRRCSPGTPTSTVGAGPQRHRAGQDPDRRARPWSTA